MLYPGWVALHRLSMKVGNCFYRFVYCDIIEVLEAQTLNGLGA